MKVFILENDYDYSLELERIVSEIKVEIVEFGACNNIISCKKKINLLNPDLIISNVILNENESVFDLIDQLEGNVPAIIFISNSNSEQIFSRTLNYARSWFLVKPFDKLSLKSIVNHILREEENASSRQGFILLKDKKEFQKVPISDINYIQSEGNYCTFFTNKKKFLEKTSMKKILDKIESSYLIQIHRNYTINLNHINKIDYSNNQIELSELTNLPIGRKYKQALKSKLTE